MALTPAVKQLQNEKERLEAEPGRVTEALEALNSLGGNGRRRGRAGTDDAGHVER